MTDTIRYLLDANVFIQASRGYYAFDIAPAFWQALVAHASNGLVLSIDRVRAELERGKDDLANWATANFHNWFAPTNEDDVLDAYRQLMSWAQGQQRYLAAARAEFAQSENADAWLIAYAHAKNCCVVTLEKPDPSAQRKIKIPDVCRAFDVAFVDTYEMLRALGVRLG